MENTLHYKGNENQEHTIEPLARLNIVLILRETKNFFQIQH